MEHKNIAEKLGLMDPLSHDKFVDQELQGLSDDLVGPLMVAWDVTNRCNLKCMHCLNRSGDERYHDFSNELSSSEAIDVCRQIIELNPYSVCLAWSINAKERSNKLINTLFLQLARLHSIKAEAAIPHSRDVMNTSFKKYLSCILKYTKVSNLYISLDAIVSVVFQALVIVVVGMKVIDKEISIGQYTMMISYFSFFAGCVKYYITLGQSRQEAMASYVRIREVLSLPQESPGRIPINKILNVEIDSLSFSYSGCKPLFNKFSFKFETNNVYLLTGDNGTGKSTLVDIIIGLRDDYSSGRILYNGIDIKEIDAFSLRKNNISIMLQSSIDEGIAVGEYFDEASVTSDQVSNFIKDNNLFSFYHFFCTDDIWSQGMKAFSRGEIQKIRLLRSLTKETANFLILDEPSSFMDFESSNELMSVLQSVRNDRIILLISHDPIYSESDFIKISI